MSDDLVRALPAGITLARTSLPDLPEITLALLDPACLDSPLSGAGADAAHARPPYWSLAWASGQVLARHLLDDPARVRGKRVVDFGSGSGVVAIAAALAGALEVVAVDKDATALVATSRNAALNGVVIRTALTLEDLRVDALLAADVLYDRDNGELLSTFRAHADHVFVAESRFATLPHDAYVERFARSACTFPDIDESDTLKHVRVFEARA